MGLPIDIEADVHNELLQLCDSKNWDDHFIPLLNKLDAYYKKQLAEGYSLSRDEISCIQGQCKFLNTLRDLRGTLLSMKRSG